MSVTTVGIRELKTHLSQYISRVKQGEVVIITERGTAVGRIIPHAEYTVEEKLLALRESGFLSWQGEGLPPKLEPRQPTTRLRSDITAADLLLEDRR